MSTSPVELHATAVPGTPVAELGEGPIWDPRSAEVIWVDVPAGLIHAYSPASGTSRELASIGHPTGCVVPRTSGGYLVGRRGGVVTLAEDGSSEMLAPIEPDNRKVRINDGKCDPQGRFWVGSVSTEAELGRGTLYCLHPDGDLSAVVPGVSISNGLAWTKDRSTMYFIDTLSMKVDAFDYSERSGLIAQRRTAVEIPPEHGLPDGMSIDAEDCLWVAMFSGSAVRRYSPTGELLAVVHVPTGNVTSCAFGGPNLTDLYITTAQWGGPGTKHNTDPAAGLLYVVKPGVAGAPVRSFSG